MPATDVATAVKWLRDAKAAGFRGVILSAYPSGGAELSADDDPFWEAAEQEQMPVHIHSGLSHAGKRKAGTGAALQSAQASFGALPGLQQMGGAGGWAIRLASRFIYSGIAIASRVRIAARVRSGLGPHFPST